MAVSTAPGDSVDAGGRVAATAWRAWKKFTRLPAIWRASSSVSADPERCRQNSRAICERVSPAVGIAIYLLTIASSSKGKPHYYEDRLVSLGSARHSSRAVCRAMGTAAEIATGATAGRGS